MTKEEATAILVDRERKASTLGDGAHAVAVEQHRRDEVEIKRLRALLHRDRTGLAAALEKVVSAAKRRLWIVEGRGSYEWDDERYRSETGLALKEIIELAKAALLESGRNADSAHDHSRGSHG